jgi:glutathione S-transferase
MIKLYDYLMSGNGYKVRLILSLLGVPFERVELESSRARRARPRS